MQQVEVTRSSPADTHLVGVEPLPLSDGEVRLAIESFSVTANNVTYAVMGEAFGYWNFFPATDPARGIVPMWGHARVLESRHPDLIVGERVYGYLPMADTLDVLPGRVAAAGFSDMAAHRQPMSPIYNQYTRLNADPEHDPSREGERMIFGPLFKTGFLIEHFLRSENWFGASQLVVTSASSKTAMGLASVVRDRSPAIKRIGLTSAGNVAFVEASGLYDVTLAYEAIASIPRDRAVSVDFAGNGALLGAIHQHFGVALAYSCLVGATHIGARGQGSANDLPGPVPTLFFAPDHAVALFKSLGPEEAGRQMANSWTRFLSDCGDSVTIETVEGLPAAAGLFAKMVTGQIDPAKGMIVRP